MLSSNPDPGNKEIIHCKKNTSLFNAPLKKPQLSILLHFVIFLFQGTTIENFLNLTFEQSSVLGTIA